MKIELRSIVFWGAVVGAALACGEPEPPGVASAPPLSQEEPSEPGAASPLPAGEFRIAVAGDRITLEAAGAERGAILAQLGDEMGFELVSEAPLAPLRLDLMLQDQALEEVLGQLLPGQAFRVEYRYDADRGAHWPGRVLVGEVAGEEAPAVAAAPGGEEVAARILRRLRKQARPSISQEERARLRAEFEARDAAARAALDSEDPEVRAAAIADVDIDGPGRDLVFALAADDPDPQVRAEAVKLLGEEDSMAARDALYAALQDPAPEVVMEALDWIEAVGDASSTPYLDPLIDDHPNDRVRDRAYWVRSFLEE